MLIERAYFIDRPVMSNYTYVYNRTCYPPNHPVISPVTIAGNPLAVEGGCPSYPLVERHDYFINTQPITSVDSPIDFTDPNTVADGNGKAEYFCTSL